jgi:serine/threonine protein kinase
MTTEIAIDFLLSKSQSPNISTIINYGTNYIIMKNYGRMLSSIDGATCYRDIVIALEHAHKHGVSHNDIRSPNIIVYNNASTSNSTLIDWGNASISKNKYSFVADMICLVRLFIVNKYFLGVDSKISNEIFFTQIPNFFYLLVELANDLNYNELIKLWSLREDATVNSTSDQFNKILLEG